MKKQNKKVGNDLGQRGDLKPNRKKVWNIILICIAALLSVLVALVSVLILVGKNNLLNRGDFDLLFGEKTSEIEIVDDGTVVYKDQKYKYNENVVSVLFIGIDKYKFYEERSGSGQADALFLANIDTKTGRTTIIPIPRDCMAEIDVFSEDGKYLGIRRSQICLSYGYGDGKHSSCKNTAKAVSRMFCGVPINAYVAIDMDAIEVISEKVDGVDVVLTEDTVLARVEYKAGEQVNLRGYAALDFVVLREDDLEASLKRMGRQKQFIDQFAAKVVQRTKKDITTPITIFNSIKPYMVTNLDVADISFLTSCFLTEAGNTEIEYKSIAGEATKPGEYIEYVYDFDSVYNIIIDVFYTPVNS